MRPDEDAARMVLSGPTMGTRWAAVAYPPPGTDRAALEAALQASVERVDAQMSVWKPDSDIMRLNRAAVGTWVDLPTELLTVLGAGIAVGRASGGAFELAMGDVVAAWGFGPGGEHSGERTRGAGRTQASARDGLELDLAGGRARKLVPLTLDLNGIAKGFGVDELARVMEAGGVVSYLASIDGEVRAGAAKPGGRPWAVAVEAPEPGVRRTDAVVELVAGALATSGDYRHRRVSGGDSYSHTMDPATGRPVRNSIAAVTVRAGECMLADAWATALMVLGPERGLPLADAAGVEAMFAAREPDGA